MRILVSADTISASIIGKNIDLTISLVRSTLENLECYKNNFLSAEELSRLNQIQNVKRRKEFLSGRLAAKITLKRIDKNIDIQDITVASGVFGQPIFFGKHSTYFELSISHTDDYTTALIAPLGYPIGVDIELLNENNISELVSLSTPKELRDLKLVYNENDLCLLTRIWSLKESLSKAIKCGFTIPLDLYELDKTEKDTINIQHNFSNFQQYRGLSSKYQDVFIGLTLPKIVVTGVNIETTVAKLHEKLYYNSSDPINFL